jgi:mannose-6-phosphate isomerase-like protein (cupin superfamily)
MSVQELFGRYPFPPDQKRPVHIRGELIYHFIYPLDQPRFSDLNYMFVSTDRFQVCSFQLGPGGVFEPPDVHWGDEVYYILDGTMTLENPMTGQCVQAKKGEVLFLPKFAWHKGYNFEQEIVRILAIIAPKAWQDNVPPTDFDATRARLYKVPNRGKSPADLPEPVQKAMGTVDDVGRWPLPGPEARKEPIFLYHVTDGNKLRLVHGREYPMLIKLAVSNDLVHVGEFVIPAGGVSARVSEPDSHRGDCAIYVERGPITFFLPDTSQAFDVHEKEVMFIPEGTRYQLVNYSAAQGTAVFAIAPEI